MDGHDDAVQFCPNSNLLLRLPQALRLQIWHLVCLDPEKLIDLTGNGCMPQWEDDRPASDTRSLLLTCRTSYQEVASLIYSKHQVLIRLTDGRAIDALLRLRPETVGHLTRLSIEVYLSQDLGDRDPRDGYDPNWLNFESRHLNERAMRSESVPVYLVDGWLKTLAHLRDHIAPNTLHLSFWCDTGDYKQAETMVLPILTLPSLRDCWIHLSRAKDSKFSALARNVAQRAKGQSAAVDTRQFRFFDLPKELRLLILQYSDLVTPTKEVHWDATHKFHMVYSPYSCRVHESRMLSRSHGRDCTCRQHACWTYTEDAGRWVRPPDLVNFCCRSRSAFWSGCGCWSNPLPMLLVCKTMTEDSLETFFKQNRFIIKHEDEAHIRTLPNPLPLTAFLAHYRNPAVSCIRFLEVALPPLEGSYMDEGSEEHVQWKTSLALLAQSINLGKLTLRLVICSPFHQRPDWCDWGYWRSMSEDKNQQILQVHERVVKSIRQHGPLHRFFVHVPSPWRYYVEIEMSVPYEEWGKTIDRLDQEEMIVADRLEKLVMGEQYQSEQAGKLNYEQSQWHLSASWRDG